MTHVHTAPFDGSGNDDECECGQILCPDTHKPVTYNRHTGQYFHTDGSTCFLHQVVEDVEIKWAQSLTDPALAERLLLLKENIRAFPKPDREALLEEAHRRLSHED